MTREQLLTARWNNTLTIGLGLPSLIFVILALSTTILSDHAGFIGFAIFGALY